MVVCFSFLIQRFLRQPTYRFLHKVLRLNMYLEHDKESCCGSVAILDAFELISSEIGWKNCEDSGRVFFS